MRQPDRFEGLVHHPIAEARVKRERARARMREETAQGRSSHVRSTPVLRSLDEMTSDTSTLPRRQDRDLPHLDHPWRASLEQKCADQP